MLSFEDKEMEPRDGATVPAAPAADVTKDSSSRFLTPIIAFVMGIVIVFLVLSGSGGDTTDAARSKAIVFLIDGLKGTAFEEMGVHGNRAPNMRSLIETGSHAACYGPSDTRCCRTQSGARLGSPYTWQSAPGLASILTGVDANKHQVYNTSFDAMLRFASTAEQAPTFLKAAVESGLRTGAVGTSSLLTTVGADAACNAYGVLDFECGAAAISRCMRASSCNLVERMPLVQAGGVSSTALMADMITDVARLMEQDTDLIVVHITRVNSAATASVGGAFDVSSRPYAAQLYLADAIVGQISAMITERVRESHENWLILGTSDHGGHGTTFGTQMNDDELVPLFAHVHTSAGYMPLRDPVAPVSQMDVAPTILEWFGLLTQDRADYLDGKVQFVCGTGAAGGNCSATQ